MRHTLYTEVLLCISSFENGELERYATISKMGTVVNHGFRGSSVEVVDHYNLDAILSVGYHVNSKDATTYHINGILYNEDGTKRIADNTLVTLILMIAESRTKEKGTMVKVIVNLINKNN